MAAEFLKKFIFFLSLFIASAFALASPTSLTYQGRIIKSDGRPLEYSNVSFVFQVMDPTGQCLIYQEQVSGINMTNSNGIFDVPIGNGTIQFPTTSTFSILDSFNNSATFDCGACTSSGGSYMCSVARANGYTAVNADIRKLRVGFFDGNGWQTISPDSTVRSVPFAGYALSAQKLGNNVAADFIVKTGLPVCTASEFLTWNGTALTCAAVSGAAGGTVTAVTSTNAYLTIANGASIPALTLNVGTSANTVAAGDDSRIVNALQTGASAGGDLSGTLPSPTVVKIQGRAVANTAPTADQYLKYNGAQWAPATIAIADVNGLSTSLSSYLTQSAFNSSVASAVCSVSQTMYWNSVAGNFQCQSINVGFAGDVTGSIGSAKVVALQNYPVTLTAPATKDHLRFNGTAFVNSPLLASDLSGTVPDANIADVGTAGTYYKVTTDSKGRVTSGSSSLVAPDIPVLDWSKITSGKPTTLSGYGITDALVANSGGTPSLQTGLDASKPASPGAGAIYFATDTKTIYQYNSGAWVSIATATGSGGTITALTSDVSASGSGSVAATVNSVGGSTAANVHSAELAANAATNANTVSTIVKRDAFGNFSAGTVTANLTGNVTGNVTGSASLNVLKTGDSMTGNLTFAANIGSIYTAGSGVNTVTMEGPSAAIGTSYALRLPTAQGTSNQFLINDGSGNLSWTSLSSLGVVSVAVSSPITNSGTASAPNIGIQQATTAQSGYLSSTDWNTFNNKQGTGLNSANIWVGNGSNVATAVAPGGDVTMTNAGSFTVTKIRGTTVNATSPASAGQVLRYDGSTQYVPAFLGLSDIRASITPFGGSFASAGCTAGQSLYWQSSSDTFQCQTIAINDSQLTYTTSRTANTFLAAPNGSAGAASYRTIASGDLPTTGTNGAYINGGNSFGSAANIGTNDNNTLTLKTNGSARVTLDTSGNVGINSTSPQNALEVNGRIAQLGYYTYVGAEDLYTSTSGASISNAGWSNILPTTAFQISTFNFSSYTANSQTLYARLCQTFSTVNDTGQLITLRIRTDGSGTPTIFTHTFNGTWSSGNLQNHNCSGWVTASSLAVCGSGFGGTCTMEATIATATSVTYIPWRMKFEFAVK